MAWLAIENGNEVIYDFDPERKGLNHYNFITIPKGTIKKLIGRKLTKRDEPVELTNKHYGKL